MKLHFTPEIYEALINRANKENKSAAALAVEILTSVLHQEENNNEFKPNQGKVSVRR